MEFDLTRADAPAIECVKVRKDYQGNLRDSERSAVRDLDLCVRRSEVHGFLGHNGAGKTTAIRMIMKLVTPTAGTVRIFGEDTASLPVLHRVAYLPESVGFHKFLTPREVMRYYYSLNPFSFAGVKDIDERVERSLDEVGLAKWSDTRVEKFSKGMGQRLSLALCVMRDPDLLILDEPASGLDPEGIALLLKIIDRFRRTGKTVFFSSHHISEIERVCDRVSIIRSGVLKETASLDDIRKSGETIEERYLRFMHEEVAK